MPDPIGEADVGVMFRNLKGLAESGDFPSDKLHDPRVFSRFKKQLVDDEPDQKTRFRNQELLTNAREFSRLYHAPRSTSFREQPISEAWGQLLTEGRFDRDKAFAFGESSRKAVKTETARSALIGEAFDPGVIRAEQPLELGEGVIQEIAETSGLPGGNLGAAFITGAAQPLLALPGVKAAVSSALRIEPEQLDIIVGESSQQATERGGVPATFAQGIGAAIPFVTGAGAVGTGARALGAGPFLSSIAAGGSAGAAFTPGGAQERVVGGIVGAATLGLSNRVQVAVAPHLATLSRNILTAGVAPQAARVVAAKAAPMIANSMLEAGAFTTIALVEQGIRGEGTPQAGIGELFASNYVAVLSAMVIGARFPSRRTRRAAAETRTTLEKGLAEAGPAGIHEMATVARMFNDPIMVTLAEKAAGRGIGLTPEAADALIRRGPEAVREFVTEPQLRELFKKDVEFIERNIPIVEPERALPVRSAMIDRAASRTKAKAALARRGGEDRASRIRQDAEVDFRIAEGRFQDATLEADAIRSGKTVEQLRAEGRAGEIPGDLETSAKVIPGDRSKAGKLRAREGARFDRAQARVDVTQRSADRAEVRREQAQRVVDEPQALRRADRQLALANKRLARMKLDAEAALRRREREFLRADELEQGRSVTELRAERRTEEIPEGFLETVQVIKPDLRAADARADKARVALTKERDRLTNRLNKADEIQLQAEIKADKLQNRGKELDVKRDKAIGKEAEAAAYAIQPKDSRGARILELGRSTEANAVLDALHASNATPFPTTRIKMSDFTTPEGIQSIQQAIRRLPLWIPGAANSHNIIPPNPDLVTGPVLRGLDNFRQMQMVAPRILGPDLGNLAQIHIQKANNASQRMHHLVRRKFLRAYGRWNDHLQKLPSEALRDQAVRRIVTLTESGERVGRFPAETEMLTVLHRIFGDIKRVAQSQGKAVIQDGYFPHIFETIGLGETPLQRQKVINALVESVTTGQGPVLGNRFFRERTTLRGDFVLDLPQVMDAYLHATIRPLQAHSFVQFAENTLRPRLEQNAAGEIARLQSRRISGLRTELRADQESTLRVRDADMKDVNNRLRAALEYVDSLEAMASGKPLPKGGTDTADTLVREGIRTLTGGKIAPEKVASTVLRGMTNLQFYGALGGVKQAGQFLRNNLQAISTVAEIGPGNWLRGMLTMFSRRAGTRGLLSKGGPERAQETITELLREGRGVDAAFEILSRTTGLELDPRLRRSGVISNARVREIEQSVRDMLAPLNRRGLKTLRGVTQAGMEATIATFAGAEVLLRGGAFMGAYYKGKRQGMTELAAREFGKRIASRTQFDYNRELGGVGYSGPFRSAMFQFGKFGVYQTDYLRSVGMRALQQDPRAALPADQRLMPLLRMAAGAYATAIGLDKLGIALPDYALGGAVDPIKVAATSGAEEFGSALAEAQGRPSIQGGLEGRRAARAVNLEPFSNDLKEAVLGMFVGPAVQNAATLADTLSGDPKQKSRARMSFARSLKTFFPGSEISRLIRFQQEAEDNKIVHPVTGDKIMDLTDSEAQLRRWGINSTNVQEQYDELRYQRYIADSVTAMRQELNLATRNAYRTLLETGDPDAKLKAYEMYHQGFVNIGTQAGVSLGITQDEMLSAFLQHVVGHIDKRDATTSLERLKEKNKVLQRLDILRPELK